MALPTVQMEQKMHLIITGGKILLLIIWITLHYRSIWKKIDGHQMQKVMNYSVIDVIIAPWTNTTAYEFAKQGYVH